MDEIIPKPTFRKLLADTHVGAVTVAALLCFAVGAFVEGTWYPLSDFVYYVATMVVVLDIPSFKMFGPTELFISLYFAYEFIAPIGAAWTISNVIYGVGPLALLARYRTFLSGRIDDQSY